VLRELTERLPNVLEMVGVDPSEGMLRVARRDSADQIRFVQAGAERLPFDDAHFDLVLSTTSYHHWGAQAAGLAEVARVLAPDGSFVLADLSARWIRRRGPRSDVRNPGEIVAALQAAGLHIDARETVKRRLGLPYVRAFIASR
jgi:ubiquinone/menaquinone biosynthesis C-methylase UbiE